MDIYMEKHYALCGYRISWESDKEKDLILYAENYSIKVEHKYRNLSSDYIYDDILIELVQDICTKDWGWLYISRADKLHYIICINKKPNYFYSINLNPFKKWFFDWITKIDNPKFIFSNRGWGSTINIAVKIKDIPKDLYEKQYLIYN